MSLAPELARGKLNAYQRRELRKLSDNGWTLVSVRRTQDDLNPWASVDLRAPNGEVYLTALPASQRDADWMTRQ